MCHLCVCLDLFKDFKLISFEKKSLQKVKSPQANLNVTLKRVFFFAKVTVHSTNKWTTWDRPHARFVSAYYLGHFTCMDRTCAERSSQVHVQGESSTIRYQGFYSGIYLLSPFMFKTNLFKLPLKKKTLLSSHFVRF